MQSINDTRVCAGSVRIECLDSDQFDLLCYTESGSSNCACDVTSVSILICVDIVDKVGTPDGTSSIFLYPKISITFSAYNYSPPPRIPTNPISFQAIFI